MKLRFSYIFAVACAVATTFAQAQTSGLSSRQQIEPLLHEMELAANAHDTDRFMAAYLHQPALTYVIDGVVIHGWQDLRDQQAKWWNNGKTEVVFSRSGEPEFIVLGPETVIVTETLTLSGSGFKDGAIKPAIAVSMIWKHLPEGWRIVYAHESSSH